MSYRPGRAAVAPTGRGCGCCGCCGASLGLLSAAMARAAASAASARWNVPVGYPKSEKRQRPSTAWATGVYCWPEATGSLPIGVLALLNRSMKSALASRVWWGGSRRVRCVDAREVPRHGEPIKRAAGLRCDCTLQTDAHRVNAPGASHRTEWQRRRMPHVVACRPPCRSGSGGAVQFAGQAGAPAGMEARWGRARGWARAGRRSWRRQGDTVPTRRLWLPLLTWRAPSRVAAHVERC